MLSSFLFSRCTLHTRHIKVALHHLFTPTFIISTSHPVWRYALNFIVPAFFACLFVSFEGIARLLWFGFSCLRRFGIWLMNHFTFDICQLNLLFVCLPQSHDNIRNKTNNEVKHLLPMCHPMSAKSMRLYANIAKRDTSERMGL